MVEDLKFKTTSTHIPINSSLITKFYQNLCIRQLSTLHMKNKWLKFQNSIALRFLQGHNLHIWKTLGLDTNTWSYSLVTLYLMYLQYFQGTFRLILHRSSTVTLHSAFLDLFLQNSLIFSLIILLGDLISNPLINHLWHSFKPYLKRVNYYFIFLIKEYGMWRLY